MGFIAKCLAYAAPWLKFDRGLGGDVRTGRLALPPGIAARPVTGDSLLLVEVPGTGGRYAVAGVVSAPGPTVGEGEVAVYVRNGAVFHLHADESATLTNPGGGEITMAANGEVTINGTVFKPGGIVEATSGKFDTSLEAAGAEVVAHTHAVTAVGSPTGPLL